MSFTNFNPTLTLKLIYSILILSQAWLYMFCFVTWTRYVVRTLREQLFQTHFRIHNLVSDTQMGYLPQRDESQEPKDELQSQANRRKYKPLV